MKQYALQTLEAILTRLTHMTLWRFKPTVIGVTGSVGKTSTKIAVASVLAGQHHVRYSKGNLNTELGLMLTVLGDWSEQDLALVSRATPAGQKHREKMLFWLRVIAHAVKELIRRKMDEYPEVLILEYGVDRPQDMKKLLKIARPAIGILTAIGELPVHVEFYGSPKDVAREKGRLLDSLPASGYAIVNADDPTVMGVKDRTRAQVVSFGFDKSATIRIGGFEHRTHRHVPEGISFKIEYGGSFVPVRLNGVVGKAHAYAAAAAAAVGVSFGMNLVKISQGLSGYHPVAGRMRILPGMKGTVILDDSYNASPLSMASGLETIAALPGGRRIAILGDMLELGEYSVEAHEKIGRLVAKTADALVAVGPKAKLMAESAAKEGGKEFSKHIAVFSDIEELRGKIGGILQKGDVVLIKASHGVRLYELVDEIVDRAFAPHHDQENLRNPSSSV